MLEQQRPRFDPLMFTPAALRQEAIAVHARLAAVQVFMQRQRASTAVRQSEAPALLDGRGAQAGTTS